MKSGVWSVKCGVWSVLLCLCLFVSMSVSVWEGGYSGTVGFGRLRGSMGATFCHLAALLSAIEFLFWDHWKRPYWSKS